MMIGVGIIMENKICKRCNKKINSKEKGTTWITFENGKDIEVIHWHWKCFLEWKKESLENRAKKLYSESMIKALPKFRGMINKLINNEETNKILRMGNC